MHGPVMLILLDHLHQLLSQQVQFSDTVVAYLYFLPVDQQIVRYFVLQLLLLKLQDFVLLLQTTQISGSRVQLLF